MIILAVEIECPKCGSKPGQRCVDPLSAKNRNHTISYSFHLERIIEAERKNEQERRNNASTIK